MVFVFDLRSVCYDKTDLAKGPHDLLANLRQRMQLAQFASAAWKSEIGWFLWEGSFQFQFGAAFCQGSLQLDFYLVDQFACAGPFFLRQRSELFHQRGELAVGADPVALGVI